MKCALENERVENTELRQIAQSQERDLNLIRHTILAKSKQAAANNAHIEHTSLRSPTADVMITVGRSTARTNASGDVILLSNAPSPVFNQEMKHQSSVSCKISIFCLLNDIC